MMDDVIEAVNRLCDTLTEAIHLCIGDHPKLRLKEIINSLKDSEWSAYNFNSKTDLSECKGLVKISQLHKHIFSFDFESYENHQKSPSGNWKARFFINENTLTTADLVFRSGVDFGFKRIMFPLDRNYEELFLLGTPPAYGNQVLLRKDKQALTKNKAY